MKQAGASAPSYPRRQSGSAAKFDSKMEVKE
jgi:hypothetical protein